MKPTRSIARLVALGACAVCLLPAVASARTIANPRGTVIVGKGELVKLTFKISGGVGYDWELKGNSAPSVFRLLSVKTKSDNPDPRAVGGTSTKTYTFRARKGGTAKLKYVYDFRGKDSTRTVKVVVATAG